MNLIQPFFLKITTVSVVSKAGLIQAALHLSLEYNLCLKVLGSEFGLPGVPGNLSSLVVPVTFLSKVILGLLCGQGSLDMT